MLVLEEQLASRSIERGPQVDRRGSSPGPATVAPHLWSLWRRMADVFRSLPPSGDVASTISAASPNAGYNVNGWYTMQVSEVAHQNVEVGATWAVTENIPDAFPVTSADCAAAHLEMEVYGWVPGQVCWEKIAAKETTGKWTHMSFFGSDWWECQISIGGVYPDTSKYTYLRIAGNARYEFPNAWAWRDVRVSATHHYP